MRAQQPFDFGNGFCNTAFACKIMAEIRQYDGNPAGLESTIRNAAKKGKIRSQNIGHCMAWNIQDVKDYSVAYVNHKGVGSQHNPRPRFDEEKFIEKIRQVIKEELAIAFK